MDLSKLEKTLEKEKFAQFSKLIEALNINKNYEFYLYDFDDKFITFENKCPKLTDSEIDLTFNIEDWNVEIEWWTPKFDEYNSVRVQLSNDEPYEGISSFNYVLNHIKKDEYDENE